MIKQTKKMLGIFNSGGIHCVVESIGATTFYSDKIYTHKEANDFEILMLGKPKPTVKKLQEVFFDKSEKELKILAIKGGLTKKEFDDELKVIDAKVIKPIDTSKVVQAI